MLKSTVIIPTKNGGDHFHAVLDAVLKQETPWEYGVLVIDSGSTDDTLEYAKSFSQVQTHSIPSAEFGHGKTRNLAISLTEGEYIVLITQDAMPANYHWLYHLVEAVEQSPKIAGAFGRHLPYPDDDPYLARDLSLHFEGFLNLPQIMRIDDPQRYKDDEGYRQGLHFFSNNNACMRRSVWKQHPLPEVDFAEDQIWAKTVIEAGFEKAYAHDAVVYHSHAYNIFETIQRSFDESKALHQLFGYTLCPSLRHLIGQVIRGSLRDFSYSKAERSLAKDIFWVLRSPFYHFSRQLGYYLGSKSNGIPQAWGQKLSLDQGKKMGRKQ